MTADAGGAEAFAERFLVMSSSGPAGAAQGGGIQDRYTPDAVLRSPEGLRIGGAAAVSAAMEMRHAFPDGVGLGEDVIWCGTEANGMALSKRVLFAATHRGGGRFGQATARRVRFRTITESFVKDGSISDEWLICDNGAILRQIGQDPRQWAFARITGNAGVAALTAEADQPAPHAIQDSNDPTGAWLADLLTRLMEAEFSAIPREYDHACALSYPGGIEAEGHAAADRFWLPLRAAFPSARFTIHHAMGREDPRMAPRASVRWTLSGGHEGQGAFGPPSGVPVYVMGITHAEIGPRGLRREWTLYDEAAIWMQILSGQG